MVNLTIDNINVSVPEGTTIMDAAKMADIPIPKLCYLKDINEIAACRVCVVELEGMERLVTSCNNVVKEGMVIHTNSPKVRTARRQTVQLILSQHDCKCATCVRSGNCTLQSLANDLNIIEIPFKQRLEEFPWDKEFPLIRDSQKCIKCMRCIQVCDKIQDLHIWDVTSTGSRTTINVTGNHKISEVSCSLCGQCITHCPVGALRERDDTEKVWDAIADDKKVVVAQVAPAVRAAWGEALGLSREEATVGKIMDALKKMGIDYVFDTSFTADLTIMEEGNEFLQRFTKGELNLRPMFTSCCPGWVRFLKSQYPHLVPQLSTAKSPQQMFGAVMKTYFAEKLGVKCYDKELLTLAAKQSGLCEELFETHDEKPTSSFLYSLVMDTYSLGYTTSAYMDMPINHKIFLAQFDTIKKLADQESCVIVGRCADYALADYPNMVSVFITGDDDHRIDRLTELYKVEPAKAKDIMAKTDKKRASYYNYYSSKKWGDARSYNLCINSSTLGIEGTADMIISYAKAKQEWAKKENK